MKHTKDFKLFEYEIGGKGRLNKPFPPSYTFNIEIERNIEITEYQIKEEIKNNNIYLRNVNGKYFIMRSGDDLKLGEMRF